MPRHDPASASPAPDHLTPRCRFISPGRTSRTIADTRLSPVAFPGGVRGAMPMIVVLVLALIVVVGLIGGGVLLVIDRTTEASGDASKTTGNDSTITVPGLDVNPANAGDGSDTTTPHTQAYEGRDAALKAVDQYLATEQLGQAEVIIKALIERDPDDLEVLDRMTEVLLSEERHEEALRVLERIVELDPENAPARFRAGLVANMENEVERSIEHFRQASLIDRGNPQYPLYLAQMYIKQHELGEAKTRLLQAIALDPMLDKAWGTLTQIALMENNPEMAQQYVDRARQLKPGFLLWKIEEAKIKRRLNEPQTALELLQALPLSERQHPLVVEQVALCWAMMNEPEKAAEVHVELLNRDPSQWTSAVAASRYFLVAGDEQQATRWLHFAQRTAPDEPEVRSLATIVDPDSVSDADDDRDHSTAAVDTEDGSAAGAGGSGGGGGDR
ncbi:MAG: tetratricopeptide repeat protein, partial [Planctomycetota bacterium]